MEDYKALAPGYQPKGTLTILHISEVSSFELLEDQTSGAGAALGGAIVGGIFGFAGTGAVLGAFAGAGKSKQIDLKIVTSNFSHPQIIANLYKKAGGNSNVNKNLRALPERTRVSRIDTEIQELFSTLEGLLSRK